MHIKHWQGYGIITAKKIKKTTKNGETTLTVKVSGNHEYGLVRDDIYDLKRWLIDRYDKSAKDINCYSIDYDYNSGYERNANGIDEEYCIYTFRYEV